MLKLKVQYFGYLMQRTDSMEKTLMLGKIHGGRRRGWQRWDGWMVSPTQKTWVWVSSGSWWWTGKPGVLQSMGSQRVGHNRVTELNWGPDSKDFNIRELGWCLSCVCWQKPPPSMHPHWELLESSWIIMLLWLHQNPASHSQDQEGKGTQIVFLQPWTLALCKCGYK